MQSWKEIIEYWLTCNGNNILVIFYLLSLAYLLIFEKKVRMRLAFPAIIITLAILNPITFNLIFPKLFYNGTSWRAFWMIPEVTVIAFAFASLVKRVKHRVFRPMLALFLCGLILLSGPILYTNPNYSFTTSDNYRKIPQEAIDVVDTLLTYEAEPHVVMDQSLMCYTRQVSGHVIQMYGRDAQGYIQHIGEQEYQTFYQMIAESPDFGLVSLNMRELGFRYIVVPKERFDSWHYSMENNKFVLIAEVDAYQIWVLQE